MIDIEKIADDANLIVSGYAFLDCEEGYRVMNLNEPEKVAVLSATGEVLETTMDDIELVIVKDYFMRNQKYMENKDAEIL